MWLNDGRILYGNPFGVKDPGKFSQVKKAVVDV